MASCSFNTDNSCDKSCVYEFFETSDCVLRCFYKACNASITCQDQSACSLQTECYSRRIPLRNFLDVCNTGHVYSKSFNGRCGSNSWVKMKLWTENKDSLCQVVKSPTSVAQCLCKECWWLSLTNCGNGPWFYCSCEALHRSTTTEMPTTTDYMTSFTTTESANTTLQPSMASDSSNTTTVIGGVAGGVIAVLLIITLIFILLLWFRKKRSKYESKTSLNPIDNRTYGQQEIPEEMHYEEVQIAHQLDTVSYHTLVDKSTPNHYDQPRELQQAPSQTEYYEQPQAAQYEQTHTEHYEQPHAGQYDQTQAEQYEQPQEGQYEKTQTEYYEQPQAEQYEQPQGNQYEGTLTKNFLIDSGASVLREEKEVNQQLSDDVYENELDLPEHQNVDHNYSIIIPEKRESGKINDRNFVNYVNVSKVQNSTVATVQENGYVDKPLDKFKNYTKNDNYDHLERFTRGHDDSDSHYDHLS